MRLIILFLFCAGQLAAFGRDTWQSALSRMPLNVPMRQLTRTNCVQIMLDSFHSNNVVKGIVFMPGATDEFYMFHRAKATLTNAAPTLLDAVIALTNQTFIRATFRPPLLLLHTVEDPTDPLVVIRHLPTGYQLEGKHFVRHADYYDKDWDYLLPILKKSLSLSFSPRLYSMDSWHFYRHSFAGWNLNGWETLQAVALAGKTKFTINRKSVAFEGDERIMAPVPALDQLSPVQPLHK